MEKLVNVRFNNQGDGVIIIDQRALPLEVKSIEVKTAEAAFEAIKTLSVRGAPAIGIFAAYALAVLTKKIPTTDYTHFKSEVCRLSDYLNSSRPTAVNLSWALKRMKGVMENHQANDVLAALWAEALAIRSEDVTMCRSISETGVTLIKPGMGIITHCNAGPLATSEYGTALGPLFLAKEQGLNFHVFADETRPLLQGARLTSFELHQAGIDVTLICDNMASIVMKSGQIQLAFVGADRIAANGDTANKIGTSGLAILAKHYGIPFYVFAPYSTIDLNCATGADIEIEQRHGDEIAELYYEKRMAPYGVKTYNPAFDVTDHALISGIVTEKGLIKPPFKANIAALYSGT